MQLQGVKSFLLNSSTLLNLQKELHKPSLPEFHLPCPLGAWSSQLPSCSSQLFCLLRGLCGASVLFASTTPRSHAEGGGTNPDTDSCKLMALISLDERGSYYKAAHAGCMSVGGWFTPKGERGSRPGAGLWCCSSSIWRLPGSPFPFCQLPPATLIKFLGSIGTTTLIWPSQK